MTDSKAVLAAFIEREADDLNRILRSYVVRMGLAPPGQADDITTEIVNEVVVAALANAHRYDLSRRPMPWLLGIGLNLIRARGRQVADAHEVIIHDDDVLERLAIETNFVHAIERQSWLQDTLAPLSDSDREVIQLAVLHDLDSVTVARLLGLTPGAVRVRLHRALKRLRVRFEKEGEYHE